MAAEIAFYAMPENGMNQQLGKVTAEINPPTR